MADKLKLEALKPLFLLKQILIECETKFFESFFFRNRIIQRKVGWKTEAIIGMKKLDDESRTFDFIVIKLCVISTIESGFVGKKQLKSKKNSNG